MIVAFAGGVGGARLAYGLSRVLDRSNLLIAVNTGDDFDWLGLAISPDLDTVCYTLAQLEDAERGWGRAGETWKFMETLSALGQPDWFRLGDADLALHVTRTRLKAAGASLSTITRQLCDAMGVTARLVPMTDDKVATIVETSEGPLEFQEYFVRRQCQPVVRGFVYRGAAEARAAPALLGALTDYTPQAVIFCPSNPWLSIGPMLAIPAIMRSLQELRSRSIPIIAVSPIVGGAAIKGPAGKLMAELGLEVSALAVARHYQGIANEFVIDQTDAHLRNAIEALGMRVLVTDTVMRNAAERTRLASEILREDWL